MIKFRLRILAPKGNRIIVSADMNKFEALVFGIVVGSSNRLPIGEILEIFSRFVDHYKRRYFFPCSA